MQNAETCRRIPTLVAAFLGGIALAAGAAWAEDPVTRTELQRADADPSGKTETSMSTGRMMPGARVPLHTHPGDEFVYVVAGGAMELADGKVVEFPTGMSTRFPRGSVHGGVTSRAQGEVVLLTVHVVDKGKPMTVIAE